MSEIDSLEVVVTSKAKSVNDELDKTIEKMKTMSNVLGALIKNTGLENVAKQVRGIALEASGATKAIKGISGGSEPIKKVTKSLDELLEKYDGLGKGFKFSGSTTALQKQIDKYTNSLENAKLKKEDLEKSGKTSGKAYEDAIKNVVRYGNQLESLKQQLSETQAVKPQLDFKITGVEEAKQAVESINDSITRTESIPAKDFNYNAEAMKAVFGEAAGEIENWGQAVEKFGRNAGKILNEDTQLDFKIIGVEEAKQAVESINDSMGAAGRSTTIFRGKVEKVLNSILNIGRISKEAVHIGGESFKKLGGLIKGITSKALKLKNGIMNLQKQSGKGLSLGKMLGTSILFSSVFQAIGAIKQAVKEGSDNLVQHSGEYNNSISSMVSSLLYLKNAWAAAFSPIINVVAPYISTFINILAAGINKIGQFFAALTGKSITAQSKKVWSDYGASLTGVGKGASGAAKGLDKAAKAAEDFQTYTLGIDELNIQPQTDSGSKNSGGAGGSGGSEIGELSPTDMFETVPVENGISEFANKVKEAWRNADFTEIGSIVGLKLKSGLESIPWETIHETANKVGKSLATLINGFVEVDGLGYTLGEGIGQAYNTAIGLANSFIDNTKWGEVGTFIGEGANGAIDSVDWAARGHLLAGKWNAVFETVGEAARTFKWADFGKNLATSLNTTISDFDWAENGARLGDFVKGLLDTFIQFAENTNWQELGNNIAVFIGSIDWTGITEKIAEGVGAAVGGLAALLWGLVEDAWKSVVGWWKDTAFEDGQFTIEGLLNGIWEGIKGIGAWIKEHIFTPFIDGFKNAFGIHSPSTVMEEQGGYIMQGLLNGISELLGNVILFFGNLWEKIKVVFSPETVTKFFSETFTNAYNAVKNAFSFIGTWFQEKYKDVTGAFRNIKQYFKDAFQGAYDAVKKIWNGIGGYFKGIANDIITPIGKAVNGVIGGINWILEKVGSKTRLSKWDVPKFATGTNGLPRDTVGMVNDQAGSTYKELIVPPSGKPFIPEGRNVILPMEKGTKIMPAKQTKNLMGSMGINGMLHFAGGIGDFFGGMWEKFTSFTGEIWDYMTNPEKVVQIAIDKFTDISGWDGVFGSIASGAVSTVFDSVVDYVKRLFDSSGGGGVEKAVRWAIGIANDNSHGYDQANRWGNPDYDCSALVISAFEQAGIKLKSSGAYTTANLYDIARKIGFKDITSSVNMGNTDGMRRGDILLSRGRHAAIYIGDGKVVQASSNEHGGIRGGKPGDQTGKEIWTRPYYNYPWTDVLRYVSGYKNGIGKISASDLFPRYEVGGFPEDGIFMANHDEIVGRFSNGRTAVANDYQIEKGVEEATYRGYMRAHAETRETTLLEEIRDAIREGKSISIDGREIVAVYDSRKARMGYPLKAY